MKFYAIGYRYQEYIYVDFEKIGDTHDLGPTCFLPTREMAEQFIEDELSIDYVVVEITLETLRDGVWSYTCSRIEEWEWEPEEELE